MISRFPLIFKWVSLFCLFLVGGLGQTALSATESEPKEGVEYRLVQPPQPTSVEPGKVEVLEFFWYGCPHCYAFDPIVNEWQSRQKSDVVLVKVPVAFNEREQAKQKTYYSLVVLGKEKELHSKFFDGIHKDRLKLNTSDEIAGFMSKQGIPEDAWKKVFDSFSTQVQVQKANKLADAYKIDGVPYVVVNGKYVVDLGAAGGLPGVFRVVDFLVEKERAALQKSKGNKNTKGQKAQKK